MRPTQSDSILALTELVTGHCKHTNFNLVGVEFGSHVAAVGVELSSAGLVRVSDEPDSGRPITVAPSPLKGQKRPTSAGRRNLYLHQVTREFLFSWLRSLMSYTTIDHLCLPEVRGSLL